MLLEKAFAPQLNEPTMLLIYYLGLLVPLRVAEWALTIWLFFDRDWKSSRKNWKWIALGILCSYLLDALAIFSAFVVPGGFWIC